VECNEQKVDALITEDQRVTGKMIMQLGIGGSEMQEIIKDFRILESLSSLGYLTAEREA
jgi:16S rRNA C1402 (ribose-2'-O) methylase RsmI